MKHKKPKKRKQNSPSPCLFVFNGEIRNFDDGTMIELYTKITPTEWKQIVDETIKYKIFVECLKETAFPILKERWTKEDDWWRLQLEIAVSRMRNLEPMLFLEYNQDDLKKIYTEKMKNNAEEVVKDIKRLRETQLLDDETEVSEL